MLGFNNTSTLVGHFVSSPREREKRDRTDSRRDEREGQYPLHSVIIKNLGFGSQMSIS